MIKNAQYNILYNEEFKNAHGKIPYGMTNDYMFRAVLQSNSKALRGLICSPLHLRHEDVLSVKITNSIIFGESIEDKEYRLNINVRMNNNTLINLEMQVTGKRLCPDRSISYLCCSLNNIDNWAKLFKATTWEEIRMLAAEDQYIDEASKSIFQLSTEEQISKRCFDRAIYYREKRFYERTIAEQKAELADKDALIQKLIAENKSLRAVAD